MIDRCYIVATFKVARTIEELIYPRDLHSAPYCPVAVPGFADRSYYFYGTSDDVDALVDLGLAVRAELKYVHQVTAMPEHAIQSWSEKVVPAGTQVVKGKMYDTIYAGKKLTPKEYYTIMGLTAHD